MWHEWSNSLVSRFTHLIRFAVPTLAIATVRRHRQRFDSQSNAPGILLVRLDHIGDFMILTPFLRELRRHYPSATITLVVRPNVAQLAEACPYVNRILTLKPRPEIKACTSYPRYLLAVASYQRYLVHFAEQYLRGRYDLALHPLYGEDLDGAYLITYLSGASRTVGYSEKVSREKRWDNFGHDRLLTDVLPPGALKHEAERSLDIIRYLGGSVESAVPEMWWTADDELQAGQFVNKHRMRDSAGIIAFGVGASDRRRQWPFYGELIHLLAKELAFTPVLLAGPGEEEIVSKIVSTCPTAVPMEKMPLRVVAACLSRCTAFIGNDSGPMHLSAAVGLPVVEISCHPVGGRRGHGNDPERFGPLAERKLIIRPQVFRDDCTENCRKNTPHCIAGVTPEEVAAGSLQLIAPGTRVVDVS